MLDANIRSPVGESAIPFEHHAPVLGVFQRSSSRDTGSGKQAASVILQDPFHRSLRLKQIDLFWAVRVSRSCRALAIREGDLFVWFWIGTHDEYELILKG